MHGLGIHMAKITKQTSQVSHKTNECQNETALTKIIYFLHTFIQVLHRNICSCTNSRKHRLKRFIRCRIEWYLHSLPQIIISQGYIKLCLRKTT